MCIRYKSGVDLGTVHHSKEATCKSFVRNIWVGHAVALYVHVDEVKDDCEPDVHLKFYLKRFNIPPPNFFWMLEKKECFAQSSFYQKGYLIGRQFFFFYRSVVIAD